MTDGLDYDLGVDTSLGVDDSMLSEDAEASPMDLVLSNLGGSVGDFAKQAATLRELERQRRQEAADLLAKSKGEDYGPDMASLFGQALAAFLPGIVGKSLGGSKLAASGFEIGSKQSAAMQDRFLKDAKEKQALDVAQAKELASVADNLSKEAAGVERAGLMQQSLAQRQEDRQQFSLEQQARSFDHAKAMSDKQIAAQFQLARLSRQASKAPADPIVLADVSRITGIPLEQIRHLTNQDAKILIDNHNNEEIAKQRRAEESRRLATEDRLETKTVLQQMGLENPRPLESKFTDSLAEMEVALKTASMLAGKFGDASAIDNILSNVIISPEYKGLEGFAEYYGLQLASGALSGVVTEPDAQKYISMLKPARFGIWTDDARNAYLTNVGWVLKDMRDKVYTKLRNRANEGYNTDPIVDAMGIPEGVVPRFADVVEHRIKNYTKRLETAEQYKKQDKQTGSQPRQGALGVPQRLTKQDGTLETIEEYKARVFR